MDAQRLQENSEAGTDVLVLSAPYIERDVARAVLLDPEGRILLQKFRARGNPITHGSRPVAAFLQSGGSAPR
jgi:hypothetical protein